MSKIDVSIIIPIHNGSSWIDKCFDYILQQTCIGKLELEICICNDYSTDNTLELLHKWSNIFIKYNIPLKIVENDLNAVGGVGYAKNKAIHSSSGDYLCFQDVDDYMLPDRILHQFNAICSLGTDYIAGTKFERLPENSTARYTAWANNLTEEQLNKQIYTSNGPTVIMPTWFCHRSVFNRIGGFSEDGKGVPEDLIFFYKHIDLGGKIFRVNEILLIYNYHIQGETHSIHENTIWSIRMKKVQEKEIKNWDHFTIWNAGKQGRKFYKSLLPDNQKKVISMCDVDVNKIDKFYIPYDKEKGINGNPIKIIHFKAATPPIVICVKMVIQFNYSFAFVYIRIV